MEEINRLLLIANDNVRKSMQKYEDTCFAFSRLRAVESMLEEAINLYGGTHRIKLKQSLDLISEVVKSNYDVLKTIKECMLKGKELPNYL